MSARPREIELKLDVAPHDMKALRAGMLARLGSEGQTTRLASVYYDTADHVLRSAGIALRVRVAGSEITQTIKVARGRAAGFFDREEWETRLDDQRPDLEAFAKTPAGALLDVSCLKLQPMFETRIDRTLWLVTSPRGTIEVALDKGRVVSGRRTETVAELELELKEGKPEDLFRLVGELDEISSLKPGVQVKSERGYRLASGKHKRPVKAEPIKLTADMTTAEAFQAIAQGCLRHFGLNEPLILARRMPEALHQARVGLRRLRSTLSLFKDVVADRAFFQLKADLQALSQELGHARNLDVYLARSARPEADRQPDEPGLQAFLQEIEARRSAAYDQLVERLESRAFRQLMLRFLVWLQAGEWLSDDDPLRRAMRERPVLETAAALLRRQRRKVKRRGRRLADLPPPERHRVRIEAKKLRYAAEFFVDLAADEKAALRHGVFVTALENLQENLGDLNDIQTSHEIAESFATGDASGRAVVSSGVFAAAHVSGEQDARVGALIESAAAAHRDLCDAKAFWVKWNR